MVERLVVVGIGVLVALAAYGAWRWWQAQRLQTLATAVRPAPLPAGVDGSKPAVLYFTTADCAQCRLQQTPILAQLQNQVDVVVHKLDAIEQEALAHFYGIMTGAARGRQDNAGDVGFEKQTTKTRRTQRGTKRYKTDWKELWLH